MMSCERAGLDRVLVPVGREVASEAGVNDGVITSGD